VNGFIPYCFRFVGFWCILRSCLCDCCVADVALWCCVGVVCNVYGLGWFIFVVFFPWIRGIGGIRFLKWFDHGGLCPKFWVCFMGVYCEALGLLGSNCQWIVAGGVGWALVTKVVAICID